MGCWGVTAFESDAGLDAVGFIRKNLPEDGNLELGKIIEALKKDEWNKPLDIADSHSHTSPMALAEIMVKFLDQDISDLDYDDEWAATDNKFGSITSFTADKESVQWLRDYLSNSLNAAREDAEFMQSMDEEDRWGGWFEEKDWHGWQNHMSTLVGRMDALMASPESQIELLQPREQENGLVMG